MTRGIRFGRMGQDSGQALVEFALVLPLLLLLCFGVLEFGRYYWTRLTLRHVVREAARFAVTGNVLPDSLGEAMPRRESIQQIILRSNAEFGLRIAPSEITLTPPDGGAPGGIVRVEVSYPYRAVFPLLEAAFPRGPVVIRISSVMKNERF
jgi:hypothetical protein